MKFTGSDLSVSIPFLSPDKYVGMYMKSLNLYQTQVLQVAIRNTA